MVRILKFCFYALFVIMLSGCGTVTTDDKVDTNNLYTNKQQTINVVSTQNEATLLKLPEPISMNSVQWDCGTYYSDILTDNIEAYLLKLKEDGFKDMLGNEISTQPRMGISEYQLVKEDKLLQLMIVVNDKEQFYGNSILVRLEEYITASEIMGREDALTKEEAMVKILQYMENAQDEEDLPYPKESLIGLFEIFTVDAFDKMELQAFAAISDSGFYGCFLIHRGVVSYVKGSLIQSCVADIDKDGKYELIDLYTTWESGIRKINLMAYEYITPIYFSSFTEILQVKFSNCFVSKKDYEELYLKKVDDTTVKLFSNNKDYGNVLIDGTRLVVDRMEEFPYDEWDYYYNQDILMNIEKVIPDSPPDIMITIEGNALDYTVKETKWVGNEQEYTVSDAYHVIIEKGRFIPTYNLGNMIETEIGRSVIIDFGGSIPDSIQVYDAMLNENGGIRYGERLIEKRTVKIIDDSQVQFNLRQHMSYFLSSNSEDYKRDWYRLFRIVCTWGEKECVYAFLINTGSEEKVTE